MADESNANVALEEVAEPTTDASLASPEGSTAEKEAESKPGETPPAKDKSSQESASPDESEDEKEPPKGKDVPYGQYARIKEDRNKLRSWRVELAEVGIKSKEDAEFLLKDVESAKEEGSKEGRGNLERWIVENPDRFYSEFAETYPKRVEPLLRAA